MKLSVKQLEARTSKQLRAQKSRHTVNFLNSQDLEAVALAQLGIGSKAIAQITGLSEGQITYRLNKSFYTEHKKVEGHRQGWRQSWRDGTSEFAQSLIRAVVPNMKKDLRDQLSPHYIAKEPRIAPNGANGQ